MNKSKLLSIWKKSSTLAFILVISLIAAATWYLQPYKADENYLQQAYKNPNVSIQENNDWYEITPNEAITSESIIYYPGGLVTPEAYLFQMTELSESTNQAIYVIKFPLNLAVTNINAADSVISSNPDVSNWTIAGHSLGGAMACRFAKDNPTKVDNLILLASYCDQSIADSGINTLLMYGSRDGVLKLDVNSEIINNLPDDAQTRIIKGMNHAQFGNYGTQSGDLEPEISDTEAQAAYQSVINEFVTY